MGRRLQIRIVWAIVAYIVLALCLAFFYRIAPGEYYMYYPNFAAVVFLTALFSFTVAFWYTSQVVGWLWRRIRPKA